MKITFNELPLAVEQLHEKLENIERLLQTPNYEPSISETEQFLTVEQTAEFLNLSSATIYGLVHRAAIPVNKRGKRLYFSNFELKEWLKSGRKKTMTEIREEADTQLANQYKK